MQVLFQPQIMPNILSPQHPTIQQPFSPGFLSSPPHPLIPPTFPGFVSLSSPRVQAVHQQSSQPHPSTGNGKLKVTLIKEPLTKQGVSQPLNSSAVPFIPLQVWYLVQINYLNLNYFVIITISLFQEIVIVMIIIVIMVIILILIVLIAITIKIMIKIKIVIMIA